jgi:hypothetical protein
MRNLSYEIKHLDGLTDVEKVLLINITEILQQEQSIVNDIKTHADDYSKVIELANKLRRVSGYDSRLKELREQFFEYRSTQLLNRIINEEKFDKKYGDGFVIPLNVLPKYTSYDKIGSNNPKAYIFKKLGGTITV